RDSRAFAYSSVASTSMPAPEAQMPSSTSARTRTSTRRAAYGAPEAPVMPRKTRTARLLRALGGTEELAELAQLRLAERRELRHHVVAELRRVRDVGREELRALSGLADRAQVGRTEVRAPGAEVRVTRRAAGARKGLRPGDRLSVVRETLPLRPGRDRLDDLARERLLRYRAFVRQDSHRQHHEHGRDHRDRPPQQPPLAPDVEEREHDEDDQQDR